MQRSPIQSQETISTHSLVSDLGEAELGPFSYKLAEIQAPAMISIAGLHCAPVLASESGSLGSTESILQELVQGMRTLSTEDQQLMRQGGISTRQINIPQPIDISPWFDIEKRQVW